MTPVRYAISQGYLIAGFLEVDEKCSLKYEQLVKFAINDYFDINDMRYDIIFL